MPFRSFVLKALWSVERPLVEQWAASGAVHRLLYVRVVLQRKKDEIDCRALSTKKVRELSAKNAFPSSSSVASFELGG